MTLEEMLSLEEADPCPGCPVCKLGSPRRRKRLPQPARGLSPVARPPRPTHPKAERRNP